MQGNKLRSAYLVYFGTYTEGWSCEEVPSDSRGIYVANFDAETGALSAPRLAAEARNPSYLVSDSASEYLYAVSEVGDFEGQPSGSVQSYRIQADGTLELVSEVASGGRDPCHLALAKDETAIAVSNYSGGSVKWCALSDGVLQSRSLVEHSSLTPGAPLEHPRQEAPHVHCAIQDPTTHDWHVVDLGLNQVVTYSSEGLAVSPAEPKQRVSLPAASGPRHLALSQDGRFAYCLGELDSTVTVLRRREPQGFDVAQTLSLLPDGAAPGSGAAISLSKDGRFLYASNRGHDSIVTFSVDTQTGKLAPLGHVSSGGSWPRDFALSSCGNFLLAANKKTHTVVLFRVDRESGQLTQAGGEVSVSQPTCVCFTQKKGECAV